ncbi:MAG: hypothetical protein Tsb0026_15980 [Sulfuricaulis sp.]
MSDTETVEPALDVEADLKTIKAAAATAATIVKAAKENAAAVEDVQRQAASALADVQTKSSEIAAVASQAAAAKTQIADSQAVLATKSDHIQKAQEHADKVRADLDRVLTAAKQQATEAEGEKTRTKSAADGVTELLTNARTTKGAIDTDAAAVEKALDTATQSAAQTKALADKAAEVDERIAAYEKKLAELESQSADQLKTIEGLLPGAASAGLAHSFDWRRQTFLKPTQKWEWIFIGSLGTLIFLAGQGILHGLFSDTPYTYEEVLRMWLTRLPVAAALVWLALHASREAALAKRLEEDYGFKSATLATFLGFCKQMSEVGSTAETNQPLAKLCSDTLTTVANPPGRIYDKHRLTTSPASELTEAAKGLADIGTTFTKNKGTK